MQTLAALAFLLLHACNGIELEPEDDLFEGRRLKWTEEDGLEIEIIKPIKSSDCTLKSRPGDVIEQFYQFNDKDGNQLGSNFDQKPYKFTLGKQQVIPGMDRAMTGMCIGEQRKLVIPSKLGFGAKGRTSDNIKKDQTLYYTVELISLFRPKPGKTWTTDEGIKITVTHQIDEHECRLSKAGDTIHQHYKLWLEDHSLIESTYDNNEPFVFKLGAGEVIKGIDIGMSNMCEGEQRQLTIPSDLGYGAIGSPTSIPPNATLYFVVELYKLIKRDEL